MSVSTGTTTSYLLNTAGISPVAYGTQVILDFPNKSVMSSLVNRYTVGKGYTLYAPVVGARSVTAHARDAGSDTGAEGNDVTFSALSSSARSFTKRFTYDGIKADYTTYNDTPPENLRAWLLAERDQSTMAFANDFDSYTLGLYASATYNVGSASENVTDNLIREAISKLRVANAPKPYFIVLPETQWIHFVGLLNDASKYGSAAVIQNANEQDGIPYYGARVFFTGNVPTSGGAAHGLAFSAGGIMVAIREEMTIKEWDDPGTTSYKMLMYSDWAYAYSQADYIVDFQTTDA